MACRPALIAVVLCGAATACVTSQVAGTGDRPTIVATTAIWGDVVEHLLCGDEADVDVIMGPGTDPHEVEASLADRAVLARADLVVSNGAGLEAGLADTIDAVAGEGVDVIEMVDLTGTLPTGHDRSENGAEPDHDHDHGGGGDGDPHVWFDPNRVEASLSPLAARIAAAAGLETGALDRCVARYSAELGALDSDVAGRVDEIAPAERMLVTTHDSLRYFADRYGFEVIGTVVPSTSSLAGTDPVALDELRVAMVENEVSVVFAESGESDRDATSLAESAGAEVVPLVVDGSEARGSEPFSYVGLIRDASITIVDALP